MDKYIITTCLIGIIAMLIAETIVDDQSWKNKENMIGKIPYVPTQAYYKKVTSCKGMHYTIFVLPKDLEVTQSASC